MTRDNAGYRDGEVTVLGGRAGANAVHSERERRGVGEGWEKGRGATAQACMHQRIKDHEGSLQCRVPFYVSCTAVMRAADRLARPPFCFSCRRGAEGNRAAGRKEASGSREKAPELLVLFPERTDLLQRANEAQMDTLHVRNGCKGGLASAWLR